MDMGITHTCYVYLQAKQMCEKLADHKTTVELDVHMFNSCLHLEPATQDRDILKVNVCRPHYQKYKNYETLQSCLKMFLYEYRVKCSCAPTLLATYCTIAPFEVCPTTTH
jgi:hypothetical protein